MGNDPVTEGTRLGCRAAPRRRHDIDRAFIDDLPISQHRRQSSVPHRSRHQSVGTERDTEPSGCYFNQCFGIVRHVRAGCGDVLARSGGIRHVPYWSPFDTAEVKASVGAEIIGPLRRAGAIEIGE